MRVSVAVCVQEWGFDNKAVCAVLLSDLLQFFLPLLLPCANMEGRRDRKRRTEEATQKKKKGELGAKKKDLVATW